MKKSLIILIGFLFYSFKVYSSTPYKGTVTAIGGALGMGNNTPTGVTSQPIAPYNPSAEQLSNPLATVQIYLTQGNYPSSGSPTAMLVTFNQDAVISKISSNVISNGLYAGITSKKVQDFLAFNKNQTSGAKEVFGFLAGQDGTIYAKGGMYFPYNGDGYTATQPGASATYFYNVDTFSVAFTDTKGNTQWVKNIPMNSNKCAYFQGQRAQHVKGLGTAQLLAHGETLVKLSVGVSFKSGKQVLMQFGDQQIRALNNQFTQKNSVTLTLELKNPAGLYYSATIGMKNQKGDDVSGFPLNISADYFKTTAHDDAPSAPVASSDIVTGKYVEYKTSNMQIPFMVKTMQHQFLFAEDASLIPDQANTATLSGALAQLSQSDLSSATSIISSINSYINSNNQPLNTLYWNNSIKPALQTLGVHESVVNSVHRKLMTLENELKSLGHSPSKHSIKELLEAHYGSKSQALSHWSAIKTAMHSAGLSHMEKKVHKILDKGHTPQPKPQHKHDDGGGGNATKISGTLSRFG